MALLSEQDELTAAWRALAGLPGGPGWRTIAVCSGGPCRLLAGRQTPGNEEAVLIDLGPILLPPAIQWPQGRGFSVAQVVIEPGAPTTWIGLARRPGGSLDLFGHMGGDVVRMLNNLSGSNPPTILRALLDRVRAWQVFMDRSGDGALSPEAEVGLFGELVVLGEVIRQGVPPIVACESWEGPGGGLHDFRWSTGAIEVKATAAVGSFPARIGSLAQLDDSEIQPLFLAAVRLGPAQSGVHLTGLVALTRALVDGQPGAIPLFEDRLLLAGYYNAQADRYARRFSLEGIRVFSVVPGFPRLTRAEVPRAIVNARYDVDLDLVNQPTMALSLALSRIGVI